MDLKPKSKRDQFGELIGRTYLLWRTTPLVEFANKTSHELVQSLRLHLMNDLDFEVFDGTNMDTIDRTTIMDVKLTALRFDDWDKVDKHSEVLELNMKIRYPNSKEPRESSVYFLPATLARDEDDDPMADMIDYPLMLVRIQTQKLTESVKQWLKNDFSCDITKFHVSGSVLTALVNWWTGSLHKIYDFESDGSKMHSKCLELSYYIPFTENLDSISFTISMDQLRKMHDLIQDTGLTMMDLIQEHVYNTLRIKMDHCILTRVGTPVAYISNTSQLKLILNGGSKAQYLEFLSELCDLAGTLF